MSPESSSVPPTWLIKTKRLFPHPVFAGLVSFACMFLSTLFVGVLLTNPKLWFVAVPCIPFAFAAYATAMTTVELWKERRLKTALQANSAPGKRDTSMSTTVAMLAMLVCGLAWFLVLAIHIAPQFFRCSPGSLKYYIVFDTAVTATFYMQFWGRRRLARHTDIHTGRLRLELSGLQAVGVVLVLFGFVAYVMWLTVQ